MHDLALGQFAAIQASVRDERLQCLQDRRFASIPGAQWEGALEADFANKPRFEVNRVQLSLIRIYNEYRNNRISVDFRAKDGGNDQIADVLDGLYRADEVDSGGQEAMDNAFEEAAAGGFGAWRLRTIYEDDEDEEDERQRIAFEPIYDADSCVFFDINAKRQDKADAKHCFVLYGMARASYIDEHGDDPAGWPKEVRQSEFDWCTPDIVYVAEYYMVEEVREVIRIFRTIDGEEERYSQAEFEADDDLEDDLAAVGSVEVRQRPVKRRKVRKYLMNGNRVLEDYGYIAGQCIPIVPVYGKRWYIDNVERCAGQVRLAKDAQRLNNMQLSKLGEISALSSVQKPILLPEQISGLERQWADDNVKNYPYLLLNPITGPNGETVPSGPVGFTQPPAVPQAMAALLQITDTYMQEILGTQQGAEKIVSGVSGKAVELVQQRLDMQTFIFMSNMGKAVRRCGEIWLSMARATYTEKGRRMKAVAVDGATSQIDIMRPVLDAKTCTTVFENDITGANMDVMVDVGPSFMSRRDATVRAITGMMQMVTDPQDAQVLQGVALMNMDGEGLEDARNYFRKKLVAMGVVKPSDEEAAEMDKARANQGPGAQEVYLQAEAEKATAQAAQARATTVKTVADAELSRARTFQTLAGVDLDERRAAVDTARALADMSVSGETPAPSGQPVSPEMTE